MKENNLITKEDLHLLYWKNNKNDISPKEALEISKEIEELITKKDFNTLLVDNRNLNGVWDSKVDKIWIDLMKLIPNYIPKTATICDNIINKLQLNYLSKKSGNLNKIKAFTVEEIDSMSNFLDINTTNILKEIDENENLM